MIALRCHQRPVCKKFVFGPKNGSWWSQNDTKLPEMTWTHWNCHLKPSPMYFCFSCDRFEWLHDQFTLILTLGLKVAKNGQKKAQMTKIGLNAWKMTSKTISTGYLLLLRSFWVVTWPLYNNFEFGAKIGQKWLKKAPNDQKWPECLKSVCDNFEFGAKMAKTAKMAKNGRK